MTDNEEKITGKTLIPISVIAVLSGFIFWLSTMYVNINVQAGEIAKMQLLLDEQRKTFTDIQVTLGEIKKELELISKNLPH